MMRTGLYIVPLVGSGSSHLDPRRPKYMKEFADQYESRANEFSEVALVLAVMSDVNHLLVAAQPDVFTFPEQREMDSAIDTLKAAQIQTLLKTFELPAEILSKGSSYRTLARYIDRAIQFSQRAVHVFEAKALRDNPKQRFGDLNKAEQDKLAAVIEHYGYDSKLLGRNSTLETLTAAAGEAGVDSSVPFGGLDI